MRLLLTFILSFILTTTPLLNGLAYAGVISEVCVGAGESSYFYLGDERGNSVVTKKEVSRDCNLTISSQGACIKWEDKTTQFNLDPSDYNTFRSSNYEDSLGSILAVMGAYDQLEHLWSGWKGYCEKGTKTNFDWVSDPMFWGSLLASTLMSGSQTTEASKTVYDGAEQTVIDEAGNAVTTGTGSMVETTTTKGFLVDTQIGNSYNSFVSSVSTGFENIAGSLGMKAASGFGQCLVAAGVDMVGDLYNNFSSDSEEKDCDPVDEFCEDKTTTATESDVMTMDKQQYEDLVSLHPEVVDYIVILSEEEGILTVRFINVSEMSNYNAMDQAALQEAKDKLQTMLFMVKTAMIAAKLAACGLSGGSLGGTSSNKTTSQDASRFSVKDGIGFAINAFPVEWLGPLAPYGALIKAALAIILEFATSFSKIDTCNKEKDATKAGTRHKKTQESLPYNICTHIDTKCVEKSFFGSGCGLTGYDYCCYDQVLTRILVEQIKAQLGRDYKHCTGITLRDINYVSFRQCTTYDKTFGPDGAKVVLNYNVNGQLTNPWDPTKSYQYIRKCLDFTEFKENLNALFNQDIDFSDFDSLFDDMKTQVNTSVRQ